jgi:hypothetical protein
VPRDAVDGSGALVDEGVRSQLAEVLAMVVAQTPADQPL